MPVAGRLKEGNLLLTGEVNERLPVIQDGLVAHYPFDGTVNKYIPGQIRYIRDFLSGGSTANDGNHWIELQAYDDKGINVALNKSAITSGGVAIPDWVNGSTDTGKWTLPNMTSGNFHTVDLGDLYTIETIKHWHYWGDGRWYNNTRVAVSADGIHWFDVFNAAIEGTYKESAAGHLINLRNPGLTLMPSVNLNNTLTDNGLATEEASANIWTGGLTPYNNYSVPATLVKLDETYMGEPIYRLGMTVTDAHASRLTDFRTNLGSHGVYGGGQVWKANTKYVSSIYWRPVNKPDTVFGGVASNVQGWYPGPTEILPDGWRRYSRYRNGTQTTDTTNDVIHHSFYCPSLQLNETIYIDFCAPQNEQGKSFATSYMKTSRGDGDFKLKNVLSPSKGSVALEVTFHEDDTINGVNGADQYSFGNSVTWNLPNCWQFHGMKMWYINLPDNTRVTINMTSPLVREVRAHLVFVYDDTDGTMNIYKNGILVTDGVKRTQLIGKLGSLGTDWTHSGMGTGTFYKMSQTIHSLSFYNRPLTADEAKKLYGQSHQLTTNGNVFTHTVVENPNGIPADALHIPLDFNGKNRLQIMKPSAEQNLIYEDGSVWVGSPGTNIVANPTGELGATPYSTALWDASLHPNALTVHSWSTGLNTGVPSPAIGYHAYWTKEGMNGKPCMKFIDLNHLYGMAHRWLGMSQALGTPTALGWKVGDKLTLSWYQKTDTKTLGAYVGIQYKSLTTGGYVFGTSLTRIAVKSLNTWERVSFSYTITSEMDLTAPANLYVYGYNSPANGTLWVDNVQIQKEEFLRPFIQGTVPASNLAFNFYRDYGLDWSKDWSIVYWKKPVATHTGTLIHYNIESLGSNSNSVGGGYTWWGKESGTNMISSSTPGTITPNAYFNNWRMVSLTCSGAVITVKEWQKDGTVHTRTIGTTTTVPNYYVTPYGYDFKMSGYDNGNPANVYFKDLIVAKRAFTQAELETMFKTQMRAKISGLQVQSGIQENQIL